MPFAVRAVVVAVLLAPAVAQARVLLHHDLTSLALLSDAIVAAERGATRSLPDGLEVTQMRVRRVYMGLVSVGSTLEVSDSTYALDGTAEQPLAGARDREVVLFLVRSGRAVPRWWIVGSGVRVQAGGRIYRFEQRSNPGPYLPVLQGRDPADVRAAGPVEPVDYATFELDLRAALARAEEVKAALAPTARPPRREPRLALLPPIQDRVIGTGRDLSLYRDEVALRVVASFVDRDDLDGALEALSRVIGDRPLLRGRTITSAVLADVARDAARPAHVRIEALASVWDPAPAAAAVVEQLAPLLADPMPDVRAAAVAAIAKATRGSLSRAVQESGRRVLLAAASREADPLVRVTLLSAGVPGLDRRLRGPARAIFARRRGEELAVVAGWRGKDSLSLDLAGIAAAAAPCEEHDRSTWNAGGTAGLVTRVRCADAAAPWSVTVSVRAGRAEARQDLEVR